MGGRGLLLGGGKRGGCLPLLFCHFCWRERGRGIHDFFVLSYFFWGRAVGVFRGEVFSVVLVLFVFVLS